MRPALSSSSVSVCNKVTNRAEVSSENPLKEDSLPRFPSCWQDLVFLRLLDRGIPHQVSGVWAASQDST